MPLLPSSAQVLQAEADATCSIYQEATEVDTTWVSDIRFIIVLLNI